MPWIYITFKLKYKLEKLGYPVRGIKLSNKLYTLGHGKELVYFSNTIYKYMFYNSYLDVDVVPATIPWIYLWIYTYSVGEGVPNFVWRWCCGVNIQPWYIILLYYNLTFNIRNGKWLYIPRKWFRIIVILNTVSYSHSSIIGLIQTK